MKSLLAILLFVCGSQAVDWDVITALDQYVQGDDGHYDWYELASYRYDGVTLYVVNMTSQLYQTDEFSTRSIWWHYMGIAIPDNLTHTEEAVLFIDGGGNYNLQPPGRDDSSGLGVSVLARDTGIISAYIKQVPNQPIFFYNDPDFMSRSEDSIIAWTWRTFLDSAEPSDPTVILRMPMTKAAKRGLDTIQAVSKIRRPETNVQRFAVAGASKRGWTTWSIAATDRRVAVIAPMVFSLLNFDGGALEGHNRNMDGDWSFALGPYWRENLTQEFFNPKALRVWDVEDMYMYKERLTLPILEIVSSGDEFFLTDDNHHWWNDIPDPKYLLMLPNAEHGMAPHYVKIYETAVSFVLSIFDNVPLPSVTWTMGETPGGGYINLQTNPPPLDLLVFDAVTLENDTRRDFRLASGDGVDIKLHPVWWRQNLTSDISDLGGGQYRIEAENVDDEWHGFFFQGEWEGPTGYRMFFTSQVNIIPYTYPAEACHDASHEASPAGENLCRRTFYTNNFSILVIESKVLF